MDGYESLAERRIREAQQRGEFNNLTGAGKPLDLGDPPIQRRSGPVIAATASGSYA